MDTQQEPSRNNLTGQVIVVTGGAGVLCAPLCRNLASEGGKISILDINADAANILAGEISHSAGEAVAFPCDVTDKDNLKNVAESIIQAFGQVDILINGAGGNSPGATTRDDLSFFDLPSQAVHWGFDLKL